jgi:hypothetical protein
MSKRTSKAAKLAAKASELIEELEGVLEELAAEADGEPEEQEEEPAPRRRSSRDEEREEEPAPRRRAAREEQEEEPAPRRRPAKEEDEPAPRRADKGKGGKKVTVDALREAALEVMEAFEKDGEEVVEEILGEFDAKGGEDKATKISDLAEEDFAAVLKALRDKLKEE